MLSIFSLPTSQTPGSDISHTWLKINNWHKDFKKYIYCYFNLLYIGWFGWYTQVSSPVSGTLFKKLYVPYQSEFLIIYLLFDVSRVSSCLIIVLMWSCYLYYGHITHDVGDPALSSKICVSCRELNSCKQKCTVGRVTAECGYVSIVRTYILLTLLWVKVDLFGFNSQLFIVLIW